MTTITQLEDKLKNDSDGSFKLELEMQLDKHIARLTARCQQGCEPDVYNNYQIQLSACWAAKRVILKLWMRYHKVTIWDYVRH
ncbi:EscE/YscE/SsaE family type III secretion system needle protein co-chaperone [Vibrio sp. S4M6]|uniref:EscE/YscE/SsaE family type III secretion system needle protein co-chaperone n=1 Tax=Vibrio sinus TaxID=2946865 RepID=UPI00202A2F96|nr:EscE/YscE/SsaE family type III secretion system needle protein co-chaperone [Vibrio sinus]MCL9783722.1 EscE/YscE/SsaE family type III secretion system needle protein co-chaperone [Vibrio sinus]